MRSGRDAGVARRPVIRAGAGRAPAAAAADAGPADAEARAPFDDVAVEEPLEIRVAGDPLSVTMRSPGADRELALGFLYAEGIIHAADDVGRVAHCGRPGEEGYGNVIDVLPGAGVVLAPERVAGTRRGTLTTSACGVCGRRSIDDLAQRCAPVHDESRVEAALLARLCAGMRDQQRLFARTGGVHAAALHDLAGGAPIVHEDVGRHNAVDKVVGTLVLARALPARGRVLLVSGRASFEIVQKAAAAGIPIVASVSAASSLAIDLAARMDMTLAAFVRGETMSVYAGARRIV
jgi:FdhD protein